MCPLARSTCPEVSAQRGLRVAPRLPPYAQHPSRQRQSEEVRDRASRTSCRARYKHMNGCGAAAHPRRRCLRRAHALVLLTASRALGSQARSCTRCSTLSMCGGGADGVLACLSTVSCIPFWLWPGSAHVDPVVRGADSSSIACIVGWATLEAIYQPASISRTVHPASCVLINRQASSRCARARLLRHHLVPRTAAPATRAHPL